MMGVVPGAVRELGAATTVGGRWCPVGGELGVENDGLVLVPRIAQR